ncbi:MAG: hypothetical protein E6J40_09975 [Chloroflexi bacterium]|nr:MAG: hypothetical protein E6J40_09975 [Chloroflexota bacterium]
MGFSRNQPRMWVWAGHFVLAGVRHRVVVGDRDEVERGPDGAIDQLRRRHHAVGGERVAVGIG